MTELVPWSLPEWPEGRPQWDKNPSTWHSQQAKAAIARLKVAVEALNSMDPDCRSALIDEALEAIGSIPE